MEYKVVALNHDYLVALGMTNAELEHAYLSRGSIAYCLLADSQPVLAGGVVNMLWNRGEAWVLPNKFFYSHMRVCYKAMKAMIPMAALQGGFKRIQATCAVKVSTVLFDHLNFTYEGTLAHFGPNGESCHMYSRIFP